LFAVGPGSDPIEAESERTIGNRMPPARAVFDGVAGAMMVSESVRAYPRPRVLLPKAPTMR